jgi:hypothetical protein
MMITRKCTLLGQGILRIALTLVITGLTATSTLAQTGYIYVHSKTLSEAGSPPVTFSVSGGTTAVADFVLNDDPAQTVLTDIGSSESGRLWAVSYDHELYYRDPLTPNWVNTGITGVRRVDGGPAGTCFFINTSGIAFSYTGAGAATQISAAGQFSSLNADIGSGWTTTPYAVNNGNIVFEYSGSGTTWNTYATFTSSQLYKVDVNPANGNVYVAGDNGSTHSIREITPALATSSLGSVTAGDIAYRDLAVNQVGEIFVTAFNNAEPGGWYVHKYESGTSWVREKSSYDGSGLTGGLGNALWLTMNSGGWNNGNGWSLASGPYPFYNIFSRGLDGSEVTYIDDERVRTSPAAGNSQFIPVAPGTYTITETEPGGWDLQKISVYDPSSNSSSNQVAGTATVTVAPDEVVNVVFQTGQVNPFSMTTDCANAYLETFGTGPAGSYGSPVTGQTTYHYLNGNAPGEDGYYKLVNLANPDFNTWGSAAGVKDHTAGDGDAGYMYAVNAGYDKGEFFRRHFTGVIAGANYSFSAWIIDLTPLATINPNVTFTVYDHVTQAVLGSYSTGELTDTAVPSSWKKFGFDFTGSSSEIDLVISNNGIGGGGNDLAIDDISFSLAPPTPTVVLQNSDCAGGLGSITITAPIGAYEYSIDGTTWQASPAFANIAPGSYTASVRFTGTTNCTNSATQATVLAAICGNVFHDANGLTDGNVNGAGIGQASAAQLYVSLYDGTTLLNTVPVNADGTYSFTDVPLNTTYTAVLSTNPAGSAVSVFQGSGSNGWLATGEDCCDNTGDDGATDGLLTILVGGSNVNNANFGIQQLPDSDPKSTQIFQPSINLLITLNGGSNPPVLSGSDPEDMPAGGLLSGKTVTITTVPTNSELYYDNVLVTSGLMITGFDPSKLQVKFTTATLGDTTTQFEYAYVDASGAVDPTPAIYELRWEDPMPVTLVAFEVSGTESAVVVNWVTTSETNSSHFNVERSQDARNWQTIGSVAAAEFSNRRTTYDFTDQQVPHGTIYYRLKMVDLDEMYAYSQIRSISVGHVNLSLFPNPVARMLRIDDANAARLQRVTVYNKAGVIVYSKQGTNQSAIDLSGLQSGSYVVTLTYNDGSHASRMIIKN